MNREKRNSKKINRSAKVSIKETLVKSRSKTKPEVVATPTIVSAAQISKEKRERKKVTYYIAPENAVNLKVLAARKSVEMSTLVEEAISDLLLKYK